MIDPGEVVYLTDWCTLRPVTIRVDRAIPVAGEESWFEVEGVELRDGRPVRPVRGRIELIDGIDEE